MLNIVNIVQQCVHTLLCWDSTTSAFHHVNKSACQHVGMAARQYISMSARQHIFMSACQHVSMQACQQVIMPARLLCQRISMSAYDYVSTSVCQHVSMLSSFFLWPIGTSISYYTVALLLKSNCLLLKSIGRLEEKIQLFWSMPFRK